MCLAFCGVATLLVREPSRVDAFGSDMISHG
ncbi:hypothetical protein HMPREF1008_01309 [Olsenella sp. oral taxon 809 str. F0356]|nr:hypothetical protein HMPREF1008_01309 [Olsenella sp. oral taxon 809 str. F0356]